MVPGIPAFSKFVNVVLAQEQHSRLCGLVQTSENGKIADVDVAQKSDVRASVLSEHSHLFFA